MDQRRLSVFANFNGYAGENQRNYQLNNEARRLSDGPHPRGLYNLYPNQYYCQTNDFHERETFMLKRKNSSFNTLLDSTSSMMRTASSTLQCIIGSARRASYCGQPDPSVQLTPNGNSGSLYLRTSVANSNESSLSNCSFDEQRRIVTIYDGRIPSTPVTPRIPFELMTPIEVITKTEDDPIESFVQIVLETPDDKPPVMLPLPSSSTTDSNAFIRRRHRSSSPRGKSTFMDNPGFITNLIDNRPASSINLFNPSKVHCQPPETVEPMDFSFLEPVLQTKNLSIKSQQNHSRLLINTKPEDFRRVTVTNSKSFEESTVPSHGLSRFSYPSKNLTIEGYIPKKDSSNVNKDSFYVSCPRLKITPSVE